MQLEGNFIKDSEHGVEVFFGGNTVLVAGESERLSPEADAAELFVLRETGQGDFIVV